MGVFFFIESPALLDDLYLPEESHHDPQSFIKAMETSYSQVNILLIISF